MPAIPDEITQLLMKWGQGDKAALDQLMPLVYDELRRLAAHYLQQERSGHTLQPTALVNEAYLRLVDQRNVDWRNRAQFFGLAAQMMRRILVNHAEARKAAKRGGDAERLPLDDSLSLSRENDVDILALNDALNRLAEFDEQKSKVVELRFFGGLKMDEVAEFIGKSTATTEREWSLARAWLYRELHQE